MKYTKFIVRNYKSVIDPIEIDLQKNSILPIIGVNEAGKTTLLEGILAFDKFNDSSNSGRHLIDFENFYTLSDSPALITAHISCDPNWVYSYLETLKETDENGVYKSKVAREISEEIDIEQEINNLLEQKPLLEEIKITRNLKTKNYSIDANIEGQLEKEICNEILLNLPYIHYFDDFRDSMEELIKIPATENEEKKSKWIPYLKELFEQVDEYIDFYGLRDKNPNQRDSFVRSAQRILQEKLTQHWSNFNVEGGEPLTIELKYHHTHHLEFRIIEKIETKNGLEERFFNIKDRSKGFFWYFNFIMKIEFNPDKRSHKDQDTIYLLDEPGSFLHSTAQNKLCERLKNISENNKVIFCTHSSHLLNPEQIPINSILIAEKTVRGSTSITGINELKLSRKNFAFQPILNALQIKPVILDYDVNSIVILEGIYDYYAFNLFKEDNHLNFFPSTGNQSVIHHISYMIFLGKNYAVLWDNDKDGIEAFDAAKKQLGSSESEKWTFYSLPKKRGKKVILQNLFEGVDLKLIKEKLNLPSNSSFTKTIATLYNYNDKDEILAEISDKTKQNFKYNIDLVKKRLNNSPGTFQ